jgi:hypothetical protein
MRTSTENALAAAATVSRSGSSGRQATHAAFGSSARTGNGPPPPPGRSGFGLKAEGMSCRT